MLNAKPDPEETIRLIERLKKLGFENSAFRRLHHLGDSMEGFCNFARKRQSFWVDGNNHRVHKRLEFALESCSTGAPPPGKTFDGLAQEAMRTIPPV